MKHPQHKTQAGPRLVAILNNQAAHEDDLNDSQLQELAAALAEELTTVQNLITWRQHEPTDADILAMAEWYDACEFGRYAIESDSTEKGLDHV